MSTFHAYLLLVMWVAYYAYWRVKAPKEEVVTRRESAPSRTLRTVVMLTALALLWVPKFPVAALSARFLPARPLWFWIGAAIAAAGFLFSASARQHLGNNWSQAVTVKKDHQLITTGPYALVRHPIYTGLLTAIAGNAIALGEWRGVLATALVFAVLLAKLRLEEQWMRAQFGEAYDAYSQRVRALVPFIV